jgi:hypothetical protein
LKQAHGQIRVSYKLIQVVEVAGGFFLEHDTIHPLGFFVSASASHDAQFSSVGKGLGGAYFAKEDIN